MRDHKQALSPLLLLCALGVAVRLAFLLLAGDLEFQSDEANYVYLALTWNYFGFYADSFRYFWPPGYPLLLAQSMQGFEMTGLYLVKVVQVLASASIGLSIMLFARRMFDARAARAAGLLWCFYLPLIGYSHTLWTETFFLALFLPALYLLFAVMQDDTRPEWRLVVAGALFALSLYLKEAHLYLAPVLAALLLALGRAHGWGVAEGVRRGALFLLTIVVLLAPWTLRNYEVYGRVVPVGSSLGENCFLGLNGPYRNFDLTPYGRQVLGEQPLETIGRRWLIEPAGPGWARAEEIHNTPDRLSANVTRGLDYAAEHPLWFLRSRLKKLADFVAPFSFYLRHQGLGHYADTPLGGSIVRRTTALWALLCPLVLLPLGLAGLVTGLRGAENRASRWLVLTVGLYFLTTGLVVSMSRFRIPLVPLLIVLTAGLLTSTPRARLAERGTRLGIGVAWGALLVLWWINLPEILAVLRLTWRGVTS